MADFDSVRQTIDASIKQNGTGAITGPVLNGVLNEMVDAADEQVSQLGQEVEEIADNWQLVASAPNTSSDYYSLDNQLQLNKHYKLVVQSDTAAEGIYIAVSTLSQASARGTWFASNVNVVVGKNEFEFVCDIENAVYVCIYSSTSALRSANITLSVYEVVPKKKIADNLVVGSSISDDAINEKKLSQAIGEITFNSQKIIKGSDIYNINPIVPAGKNLLNPNEYEIGYIDSSGNTVYDERWKTTGFIDVSQLTSLVFSGANDLAYRAKLDLFFFAAYDADKNFLSALYTNDQNIPYTIPSNVKYIRFAYRHDYTDFQLEEGVSKTSYVPFVGKKLLSSQKWSSQKWVCIGDSLTEVNSRTTIHYHDYVSRMTGIQVVNLGVSGTGYMQTNNPFYSRISSIPSDADVITIFGSGNDTGNPLGEVTDTGLDTICGCINHTIDLLQESFPLVPLGIVTPTPWINKEPSDIGNSMISYCEAIVEICARRSIPCLDLYHCSNLHPNDPDFRALAYSKDFRSDGETLNGVHPDENGHKLIAPRFYAFLDSLIYNSSY